MFCKRKHTHIACSRKSEADGEGDPNAFFNDTFNCLRLPHADILLIVDCCFAARAFSKEGLGKRKYELIAAAGPDVYVPSAKHNNSFTHYLCNVFDGLLGENKYTSGFPTSELYRRIYHEIDPSIKPFIFDQSRFDYGKIWLRPQTTDPRPVRPIKEKVTIGLTLQLTDMPDAAKMNELARALQYVPHVDKIEFGKLYAPAKEIQEFFFGMKKAMYVRKIIQRLRQRIEARKRGQNPDYPVSFPPRSLNLRTDVTNGHSQSFDCSQAEAFLRDGTKLPVNIATGKVAPRSPVSDSILASSQSPPLKLHNFLNFFSVAWALDLSQVKSVSPWSWPASRITERYNARGIEQAHGLSDLKRRKLSLPSSRYNSIAGHERLIWIAISLGIFFLLIATRTA